MPTQSNRVARFVPPLTATPAVDDTVLVSNVTPLNMRWGAGGANSVPEAPSDGVTYGRRNAAWLSVVPASGGIFTGTVNFSVGAVFASPNNLSIGGGTAGQVLTSTGVGGFVQWLDPAGGGGGIAEAPADGDAYFRRNAAWTNTLDMGTF